MADRARPRPRRRSAGVLLALATGPALLTGCVDSDDPFGLDAANLCALDPDVLESVLAPDAISALTLPPMVEPDASNPDDFNTNYLSDSDRVLGVVVNGEARAYPHRILWYHEIVNDQIGDTWVSVTFCPLTGSGLAFDPMFEGRRLDLGVSGLLFANNLVMYDRFGGDLYGPQLSVEGRCESFKDRGLRLVPVQEMSWGRWKELHPETVVIGLGGTSGGTYRVYPYGSYDELGNNTLLYPHSIDRSRPAKERVLAVRVGEGGRGYPFNELVKLGERAALNEVVGGIPTVVFFERGQGGSAIAFDARVDGRELTFEADGDGWRDVDTGSTWTLDGRAVEGPLTGEALEQRADSYVVFWFAWRFFQPEGRTFVQ